MFTNSNRAHGYFDYPDYPKAVLYICHLGRPAMICLYQADGQAPPPHLLGTYTRVTSVTSIKNEGTEAMKETTIIITKHLQNVQTGFPN